MIDEELQGFLMDSWVDLNLHFEVPLFILVTSPFDLDLELSRLTVIEVFFEHTDDRVKLDSLFASKDFLQLTVKDDVPTIIWVLQSILFYVLPEGWNDLRPCFFLDAKDVLELLAYAEALGSLVEP